MPPEILNKGKLAPERLIDMPSTGPAEAVREYFSNNPNLGTLRTLIYVKKGLFYAIVEGNCLSINYLRVEVKFVGGEYVVEITNFYS